MGETKKGAEAINDYFGTSYNKEDLNLNVLLRLVWRIQEEGFVVNIQDLTHSLEDESEFRIWFNREEDMLECVFGQIRQGYSDSGKLEDCLLWSIGEWCKYGKFYKAGIEWKRIRSGSPVKWEGSLTLPGEEPLLMFRIHDRDYFHLEYRETPDRTVMLEFDDDLMDVAEIKNHAEYILFRNLAEMAVNPKIFGLDFD